MKKYLLFIILVGITLSVKSQTLSPNQKHLYNYINGYLYNDSMDVEEIGAPYDIDMVFKNGKNCFVYHHNGMFFEITCNHVSMYSSVATKVVITKDYYNKAVHKRVLELTHKWLKKYNPKKISPPYWKYEIK